MIPLTTARKATVAAVIAFASPFYVLLQSAEPVTWRGALACLVGGVIGYLGTYSVTNTEPARAPKLAPVGIPRHAARPPQDGGV